MATETRSLAQTRAHVAARLRAEVARFDCPAVGQAPMGEVLKALRVKLESLAVTLRGELRELEGRR